MESTQLKICIVLYRNPQSQIQKVIDSLRGTKIKFQLDLVDNSEIKGLFEWLELKKNEKYFYLGKNLGFGKAHNISIKDSIEKNIPYHLILNPDVYFNGSILELMLEYMNCNQEVGLLSPKVLYPDGKTQYLCKRLPKPYDLFIRRFGNSYLREKNNYLFEMRDRDYNQIMEVPSLSGCFMFFRVEVLKKINGFDERFFMYLEDVDISRRAGEVAKNFHFPTAVIYHEHRKGSYKSKKLLWYHIKSALQYFCKWGWR